MDSLFITLVEKKQLTHDVYELIYQSADEMIPLPGQFLLCDTDSTNSKLRRSYSINDYELEKIHFIVKEIPEGKGGSKAICNQEIGHTMQVWGPMGNFILPVITEEKVIFIGTGTGFAPLYFQVKHLLETQPNTTIKFIFGVREERDIFYKETLQNWSIIYPNFSYQFCLSQGTEETYFLGRVTDYLKNNPDVIEKNHLFSICGSPAMVSEVREILASNAIEKDHIFFEQY